MKKQIFFLSIVIVFSFKLNAQTPECITEEYTKIEMQGDPQFAKNREALEKFTKQFSYSQQKQISQNRTGALPYIIPIVFHILHDFGPENLSDSAVIEAVRLLNLSYRKLNADTADIVPPFIPIAADSEIEFRLATIDPFGNCTNGIQHIATQKTYSANNSSKINGWPNNKYLNIWVANSLENSGAVAYAQYPGGNGATDGVMSIYTAINNARRTLTHEIGHCLNLQHIWGNNNTAGATCGDDQVNDTPVTQGFSGCNLSGSICNPPLLENAQNYMDYSDCRNMYTSGQKLRMHATLNSIISGRNNLWTSTNLIATGTDGTNTNVCAPVAEFIVNERYACSKDSVRFTDLSWNGTVTNWNWSFPGGSPATSNLQNPSVVFQAGIHGATLRVSNSSGSDSITKTSLVRVTDAPLNTIPFIESFEDSASFPGNDGYILNPDGANAWVRVTNAGSTGNFSIMMNNYISAAGTIDEWITPSMDFSGITFPITFSFKVANAQRSSTSNDELKLFYSINCGKTWLPTSFSKAGSILSTSGLSTIAYKPNNLSQWRQESVIVNAVKLKPNVRFKFQNNSDHGNNTFIDDINITGVSTGVHGIDELQTEFSLYPNPTSDVTAITFSLSKSYKTRIEVKDILGRIVTTVLNENLAAGTHEYKLPVLNSGIYIVDLIINNKHHVRKLVVS